MRTVRIRNLSKWFDSVQALDEIGLEVDSGEFLVVLGPSGCGKTTALRCIAGIEEPTTGEIHFGDTCVYSEIEGINVTPKERDVGLVFQNYALYPHLSVLENIAFGLRTRKLPKESIASRAREAIAFVGLEGFESRMPRELSGGQQQRVALARLVARRPGVLLFDEPLSNLDPMLRSSIRAELKALHRRLGATSIFVTHDQEEAMVLGDRIVVMERGRIAQVGPPETIYRFPASVSVATFTGRPATNLIDGVIEQSDEGTLLRSIDDPSCIFAIPVRLNLASGQVMTLHARPEELDLQLEAVSKPFSVYAVQPQGAETLVHLTFGGTKQLLVHSTNSRAASLAYGQHVALSVHRGNIYSAETRLLVTSFESHSFASGQTTSR